MSNGAYFPIFHMNHVKESIQIESNVLPLRFWPWLCNKCNQWINYLKSWTWCYSCYNDNLVHWCSWKPVADSVAALALAIPAVPRCPPSRRDTCLGSPLSQLLPGLCCSGPRRRDQGCRRTTAPGWAGGAEDAGGVTSINSKTDVRQLCRKAWWSPA